MAQQKKGRPPSSQIRENMVELLHCLGSAYGYQISKVYRQLFAPATRRVIYYHLRKGVELGVFEVDQVKREQGEFSWGTVAEKTYYKLGKTAQPRGDGRVKQAIETMMNENKK